MSPAEVENLLLRCDAISQVAVVGMPGRPPGRGRRRLRRAPPRRIGSSEADVIEWARAHIANYKVPRRVELVDALPLNASGKVLKGELRAAGVASQKRVA